MKKYIINNWKPLVSATIFSAIASVFAVRVQFLKGNVLDFALMESFENTLKYGVFLGIFIALELTFYYLYDINRGKFAVYSMKEVVRVSKVTHREVTKACINPCTKRHKYDKIFILF